MSNKFSISRKINLFYSSFNTIVLETVRYVS